jgi:hypothetical protein
MKTVIQLPGNTEAKVKVFDLDGTEIVSPVGRIEIEPYFFSAKASPSVAHIESLDSNDRQIQKARVVVSGTTGKHSVVKQATAVKPEYDLQLSDSDSEITDDDEEEEDDEEAEEDEEDDEYDDEEEEDD